MKPSLSLYRPLTQQDRIEAARSFGLHLSGLRTAALKLALCELQRVRPDWPRVLSVCDRFHVADAFGFYSTRLDWFFADELTTVTGHV